MNKPIRGKRNERIRWSASLLIKALICLAGIYTGWLVFALQTLGGLDANSSSTRTHQDHLFDKFHKNGANASSRAEGVRGAGILVTSDTHKAVPNVPVEKKESGIEQPITATVTSHVQEVDMNVEEGHSPYAYLWIIGAIHEDKPLYKGFLWDVLISANLLRKLGSKADFWLYVRLTPRFQTRRTAS